MSKLLDHTAEILVAGVIIFFLWGIGYLVTLDIQHGVEFRGKCIEAGMQYLDGSCVK